MVAASVVPRMLSQAPARVIKIDGDSDYMIGDVRSGDEVRKTGSGTALLVVPLAKENVTIRIEGTGDVYLMGLQDYSSIKVEGPGPGRVYWTAWDPHNADGAPPKVAAGTDASRVKKQPFLALWMRGNQASRILERFCLPRACATSGARTAI